MLGFRDRFRKKGKAVAVAKKTPTELEQLCGDDKEIYEALTDTLFLDPRKIGVSMKEAAENAKKSEKEDDVVKARFWYEIAGGLALYEGNAKKVVEFFSECEKHSPDKCHILKNPEKALAIAQEYYKRYLKT